MSQHRSLYFKIEKLDNNDVVVAELTPKLLEGEVKVEYDDVNRRTCNFTLLEALPDDWQGSRWKLYYGMKINGVITYDAVGVFIPVNPSEDEIEQGYQTKYQGVDKTQILVDAYSDIPLTYPAGTTLKELAIDIFGRVSETKLNLNDVPYALETDFTFEEGVTLEHILSTLVRSFPADWYYDRNGYAVLEVLPEATARPITYSFQENEESILIDQNKSIDTSKYWNQVVVVGGQVDTGIFRQTYSNSDAITAAGRTVTKFFNEDSATSQDQINDLATQFLNAGLQLPKTIQMRNLPLPKLEPKQVIKVGEIKYEVISFNIPLDLGDQQITAGELLI